MKQLPSTLHTRLRSSPSTPFFENVVFCPLCETHCALMAPGSDPTSYHILNLALVASGPSHKQETYLDHASQPPASAREQFFHSGGGIRRISPTPWTALRGDGRHLPPPPRSR